MAANIVEPDKNNHPSELGHLGDCDCKSGKLNNPISHAMIKAGKPRLLAYTINVLNSQHTFRFANGGLPLFLIPFRSKQHIAFMACCGLQLTALENGEVLPVDPLHTGKAHMTEPQLAHASPASSD